MSIRLYVGNLPKDVIDRDAFQAVFVDSEVAVTTKLIKDRKTGKCRGFGFVTVATDEEADQFIEKYNGHPFMESPLKIEKALPRTKGKNEQGEESEETTTVTAKPITKSVNSAAPSPSAGGSKKKKKNGRQKSNSNTQTTTSTGNESFQPDPRWASQLAQLKEMLNAQAAS
jgi:RNA recognition motif-containing protein